MTIRHQKLKTKHRRGKFVDQLEKKGAQYLGSGLYAEVYQLPKSKNVVKVFSHDVAYLEYLTTITKYQQNPFFPRIKKIVTYTATKKHKYTVVEMEALQERDNDRTWNLCGNLEDTLCSVDDEDDSSRHGIEWGVKKMSRMFKTAKKKHLREVVTIMSDLFRMHGSDLHTGNVLFRGKQLVITDPVA